MYIWLPPGINLTRYVQYIIMLTIQAAASREPWYNKSINYNVIIRARIFMQ